MIVVVRPYKSHSEVLQNKPPFGHLKPLWLSVHIRGVL